MKSLCGVIAARAGWWHYRRPSSLFQFVGVGHTGVDAIMSAAAEADHVRNCGWFYPSQSFPMAENGLLRHRAAPQRDGRYWVYRVENCGWPRRREAL